MRFTLASHNVQNKPDLPRDKVVECGEKLRPAHVVGLQEIREEQDSADVLKGLGALFVIILKSISTQIAYRPLKWKHISHNTLMLHPGDADIPTPARWIGWVILKRRLHFRWPKFLFVDTHFINGAFNNEHLDTKQQRRVLWFKSNEKMDTFLYRMAAEGYIIFVVGDFNCKYMDKYDVRQEWIHNDGIDKMFAIMPPGFVLVVHEKWKVNTPSDHDALFADVSVVRAK